MTEKILDQETYKTGIGSNSPKHGRRGLGEQYRVVINREANEALAKMLGQVNEGFEYGEITRSDLANWMIVQFGRAFSDLNIKQLRSLYFNEVKRLTAILRAARGNVDAIPEELRRVLREQVNSAERGRRRGPRTQLENAA